MVRPCWCSSRRQAQDDLFVDGVEVSGGLVGQHDFWIVDQGARYADTLLLAAGKLGGKVVGALFQSHALEGFERFLFVGHAVKVLGQHDVFEGGEIGNQVELLEDETDFFGPHAIQFTRRNASHVFAVEPNLARAWTIQAADQVHQC